MYLKTEGLDLFSEEFNESYRVKFQWPLNHTARSFARDPYKVSIVFATAYFWLSSNLGVKKKIPESFQCISFHCSAKRSQTLLQDWKVNVSWPGQLGGLQGGGGVG